MVATSQIAQTTLRSVLGQHMLDELLSERDKINAILQAIIDEATAPWGIKVSIVEVKDVEIPAGMQRAMARQAEAERERRAKVINAEGEFQASERLKDAALVIESAPDRAPAALPADAARDRRHEQLDDHLPGPDRPDQSVSRARRRTPRGGRRPGLHDRSGRHLSGELRRDPISGRTVVVAPGRANRPGAARPALEPPSADELASCPFCEGHEDRTPPETFAVAGDPAREPDTPGWRVRVVPNLYPALERQEVVIHSPRHVRSLSELDASEVAAIAETWRARAEAAGAGGFPYVHALLNEGREAGASLPHSHSQLAWLRETPPEPTAERTDEPCGVCEAIARERADGTRVLAERGGLLLCVPWAGRVPYELLVVPVEHETGGLASERLPAALELLAWAIRRLHAVEGACPLNAWLHDAGHWHIELVPRLTIQAGLELGAGIHVNTLDPDEAAARLRAKPS